MNKKKSIVIFALAGIFIILMAVFGVVEFESGLYDYTGYVKTVKLGLDLAGGVLAEFEITEDTSADDFQNRVDGTVQSLSSLLFGKGYTEAQVTYQNGRIRVEVPDVDDPDRVFDLIGRPASLEFRADTKADAEVLIDGKTHLESAFVTTDQNGQYYEVGLKFNSTGAKKFAEVTERFKGESIYIYVNNENITSGGVKVNSVITDGNARISGNYDYATAYELATKIQAGTFGVELQLIESRLISATLGQDAIKTSLIAGAIGVAIVFIFMILVYGLLGVAADIALAMYILIILWFYAVFPWVQLTLPGIAGILLGIGMAVDANVVIFERIKDEYRTTSKAIPSAIKTGFKRSMSAIIDGNITTLIGAIVLWIVASAEIKGFAITLFISIIVSMFSALLLTRLFVNCMLPLNSENPKLYRLKKLEKVTEVAEDEEE